MISDSTGPEPEQPQNEVRIEAERQLSALVITIEFTLISVMAGVVLAPLATESTDLLRNLRFEYWPYVLFGLLYVLFVWSGVISHSFTFVGWPFEIGHNLLYIVWALTLAMQASFLQDPVSWFAMNLIQYLVAGGVGVYDGRILQKCLVGASEASRRLFELALRRQKRLIWLTPIVMASSGLSLAAIVLYPGLFLDQRLHWALGCIQVLIPIGGLVYNIQSLNAWQEPIVRRVMSGLPRGK